MYLMDYHHHSNHSYDSKADMKEICKSAIEKGVREICFTEHYSVNPRVPTYGHMEFDSYFKDIEQCRSLFGSELTIKAGIELCEPHERKAEFKAALDSLPLDFIMGSVHNIQSTKLSAVIKAHGERANELYFQELYKMVSEADIDVIAHLDLIKRYTHRDLNEIYDFNKYRESIAKILSKAIERGIGIEINTSGLRTSMRKTMPGKEILSLYKELGGKILTIGSDSHKADDTGSHIAEAYELAKQCGFTEIYTFTRRQPSPIPL